MIVFLGISDSGTSINANLPWNHFKASTDWGSGVIQGFNPCNSWTIFKVIIISSPFFLLVIFLPVGLMLFTWHCSHALRTGIFEASKLVLINVAPTLPNIQVMVISLTVYYCSFFYSSFSIFLSRVLLGCCLEKYTFWEINYYLMLATLVCCVMKITVWSAQAWDIQQYPCMFCPSVPIWESYWGWKALSSVRLSLICRSVPVGTSQEVSCHWPHCSTS